MRTTIYIDGFNLYYGSLKGTPYRWLDLKKMAEGILGSKNEILKIKLFTAKVQPTQNDPTVHMRQNVYLQALKEHIPEIDIILGHFIQNTVSMPRADHNGNVIYKNNKPIFVPVCKREEKGSDVNLAVHFLNDSWLNSYDCGVIISNDSDLAEALRLVKAKGKQKVGVISPYPSVSKELRMHSHFQRTIRSSLLAKCQLPDTISGTNLKKPTAWF